MRLLEPFSQADPSTAWKFDETGLGLAICDFQMPRLDGSRHHNSYSAISSIRTLPIVALIASVIQGDREKCTSAGMDNYLPRSVEAKLLENMQRPSSSGFPIKECIDDAKLQDNEDEEKARSPREGTPQANPILTNFTFQCLELMPFCGRARRSLHLYDMECNPFVRNAIHNIDHCDESVAGSVLSGQG